MRLMRTGYIGVLLFQLCLSVQCEDSASVKVEYTENVHGFSMAAKGFTEKANPASNHPVARIGSDCNADGTGGGETCLFRDLMPQDAAKFADELALEWGFEIKRNNDARIGSAKAIRIEKIPTEKEDKTRHIWLIEDVKSHQFAWIVHAVLNPGAEALSEKVDAFALSIEHVATGDLSVRDKEDSLLESWRIRVRVSGLGKLKETAHESWPLWLDGKCGQLVLHFTHEQDIDVKDYLDLTEKGFKDNPQIRSWKRTTILGRDAIEVRHKVERGDKGTWLIADSPRIWQVEWSINEGASEADRKAIEDARDSLKLLYPVPGKTKSAK